MSVRNMLSRRCRRCERLRRAVAGVLLAVSGLALCAAVVPDGTTISAPMAAASAAAGGPDMRLIYKTVALPSGRIGEPYKPRQVVKGGLPPYRFTLDGQLPPGLQLGEDGILAGTPTQAGRFSFVLTVQDASVLMRVAQQAYVLRIDATAARPASAPSAPAAMTALTRADVDATADSNAGVPLSYKLTEADLASLLPEGASLAAEAAPEEGAAAPVVGADRKLTHL